MQRSIPGRGRGRPARIPVGAGRAEVGFRANKKPRKPFGLRGLCGSGRSPRALSRSHTLGRSRFRGRCASRRHSPRQAEFRSHGGTVPTVSGRDLSSEASAPGSDAPCRGPRAGRGADTPAKDVASAPWPRGRRRGLAGRWPRVTGLTSCLSGCVSRLQGSDAVLRHRSRRRWTDFAGSVRSPPSSLPCAPFPRVGNGPSGGVVPPGEALAFWSAQ